MNYNKVVTTEDIRSLFHDGMSIISGGFGRYGQPLKLIDAVLEFGISDIKLYSNAPSNLEVGICRWFERDIVSEYTCSHLSGITEISKKIVSGKVKATFIPQGTLCEKARAAGAGLGGFLTATGVHTPMEEGHQLLEWNDDKQEFQFVKSEDAQKGPRYILERPFKADVAIIHAYKADRMGNLVFNMAADNFNSTFVNAADIVIVEAEEIVDIGTLIPDEIKVPGFVVDYVVEAYHE